MLSYLSGGRLQNALVELDFTQDQRRPIGVDCDIVEAAEFLPHKRPRGTNRGWATLLIKFKSNRPRIMCDYSLHGVSSRPAKVGDKLVTTEFAKSSTRGFAAVGEHGPKLVIHDGPPKVAVCLLPGTELAFRDNVRYDRAFSLFGKARASHKVARFRQIDLDDPHVHHDALEFPDGQVLKITRLVAGQTATVLQLPVAPQDAEPVETRHAACSSDSRVALNRVSLKPGVASLLMPN